MVPMRLLAVTLLVVAVAASLTIETTAAPTRVRLVRVTSPVSNGDDGTLVARVSPRRRCSIDVFYTTVRSRAKGLSPRRPVLGRVRWTWRVGTNTIPGRHRIVVTCGSAGTLRTSFVTRRR
jgi:hypothetical protein